MPIINNDTLYVGSVGLRVQEVNSIIAAGRDVGALCASTRINKWAKWKPFRSSAHGFSDSATQLQAMKTVNMGFSIPSADLSSGHVVNPEWVYNKPRGISYDEWYRLLDFAPIGSTSMSPGYCHSAVCPLATWWPDSLNNRGRNRAILFLDRMINDSSAAWDEDTCISFLDCVNGSNNTENDYGDYYFALLITDNSGGLNSNVLVSTGITVDDLAADRTSPIIFDFCAYEAPVGAQEGCVVLPEYTFGDTKIGHMFDLAWVLAPLSASDTCITTNFPAMISLNLQANVNMQNLELSRIDTIEGLEGHITGTLTAISGVTDTYMGNTYSLYRLDGLSVYLDTSNADWDVVNASTGVVEDRSVVYIELGTIGARGNAYIMTSNTNLSNYDSIRPSVVQPISEGENRYYEPTLYNRLFDVPKGKTPAIATVALDDPSNTGTEAELPYIYVWLRAGAEIELTGAAFSDRTRVEEPYSGTGDTIYFESEYLTP